MKSLDTNVLARFFVDDADDSLCARQRPAAIAALSERGYVTVTVLLELEWVMRGFYALPRRGIAKAMRALTGFEHVTIEDRDRVLEAIDAFARGVDFADALHVARSTGAAVFVTFDRKLAQRAESMGLGQTVELLV